MLDLSWNHEFLPGLANSRDWKVSELESVRMHFSSKLESVRIGKCQNWKVSESFNSGKKMWQHQTKKQLVNVSKSCWIFHEITSSSLDLLIRFHIFWQQNLNSRSLGMFTTFFLIRTLFPSSEISYSWLDFIVKILMLSNRIPQLTTVTLYYYIWLYFIFRTVRYKAAQ